MNILNEMASELTDEGDSKSGILKRMTDRSIYNFKLLLLFFTEYKKQIDWARQNMSKPKCCLATLFISY